MPIFTSPLDYWVHHINEFLSEKEESHRKKAIDDLVSRNDTILRRKGDDRLGGFIFDGLKWRCQERPPVFSEHLATLDPSLHQEMQHILDNSAKAQRDFLKIRQGLIVLLSPCYGDKQKARDTLPEHIVQMMPADHFSGLSRTAEPLNTIAENPIAMRSWTKTQDLIDQYSAMRLIYQ